MPPFGWVVSCARASTFGQQHLKERVSANSLGTASLTLLTGIQNGENELMTQPEFES